MRNRVFPWLIVIALACDRGNVVLADAPAKPIDGQVATRSAERLIEILATMPALQLKPGLDPTSGVYVMKDEARVEALLVPAKGLTPDVNNPLFNRDPGLPMGLLVLKGAMLTGVPASAKSATLPPDGLDGRLAGAAVLELSLARRSSAEYRLLVWGSADEPIASIPIDLKTQPRVKAPFLVAEVVDDFLACSWVDCFQVYMPLDWNER